MTCIILSIRRDKKRAAIYAKNVWSNGCFYFNLDSNAAIFPKKVLGACRGIRYSEYSLIFTESFTMLIYMIFKGFLWIYLHPRF